jgi:hypothetical protein
MSPAYQYFSHDVFNEEGQLRGGVELHSIGLFVRREP